MRKMKLSWIHYESNEGYEIRTSCGAFEESDPRQDLDGSVVWLSLCLLLAAGERGATT